MFTLPQFTSAREIQRNYRRLFDRVKKTKQPLIVMRNNKPEVAIIAYAKLAEWQTIESVLTSSKEANSGKVKKLISLRDLWHETHDN